MEVLLAIPMNQNKHFRWNVIILKKQFLYVLMNFLYKYERVHIYICITPMPSPQHLFFIFIEYSPFKWGTNIVYLSRFISQLVSLSKPFSSVRKCAPKIREIHIHTEAIWTKNTNNKKKPCCSCKQIGVIHLRLNQI